jgi:hypothetical protein
MICACAGLLAVARHSEVTMNGNAVVIALPQLGLTQTHVGYVLR